MHIYIYESRLRIPGPPQWYGPPSSRSREHGTRDHTYMPACMHASIHPDASIRMHPSIHPDASIHPSIRMHPSIHPSIHTYTDIHTYLPTYLHTYIPTYLRTYVHTYTRTCMHACMDAYIIHTYLPTYLPTYIHTNIHTNIPTYQHTTTTGHRGGDQKNHTTIPGLGSPGSYIYIHTIQYNTYIHIYIYSFICNIPMS